MELGRVYFDKYRILEVLGKGGTSNVYLAENIKIGNKWAIKKVRNENNTNLLAEPNILKHLDHVSIPKIIDIEEDDQSIYIIEEYVDGINLKEYKLQNESINIQKLLGWILQLCDVLDYLHSREPHPIIYRDLKPDNIMLIKDNKIKLVDFGIAREYKEESSNDTVPIGTRGYAAPEQYGIGQSDERTDIFSLGITIYFLLTGKNLSHPPYKIQIPDKLNDEIQNELFCIVMRCCEILPDNRFQSIRALKETIIDLMDSGEGTLPLVRNYLNIGVQNGDSNTVSTKNINPSVKKEVRDDSYCTEQQDDTIQKPYKKGIDQFLVKKTLTIGTLGVSGGVGVTHTSIMLAGYLSKKGSVAIIELNDSKHFLEIGLIAGNESDIENKRFIYNKVHYFWDIDYSYFVTAYREAYDYIILDLGSYHKQKNFEEYLRTDIRFVIAHGMDWKISELTSFYETTKSFDPNNNWVYLLPLMDSKTIKGIKSLIKRKAYPIPYNINPFSLNSLTKSTFTNILKN